MRTSWSDFRGAAIGIAALCVAHAAPVRGQYIQPDAPPPPVEPAIEPAPETTSDAQPPPEEPREAPPPPEEPGDAPVLSPEKVAIDDKPESGWVGLPIITYAPETSLALGGFGSHFFRIGDATAEERVSSVSLIALYTFRSQIITELIPELYWNDDRSHLWSRIDYRFYPNKVWAIGPRSPQSSEESYTEDRWRWQARYGQAIAEHLFLYGHLELLHMDLEDAEPGGLIAEGELPGSEGGLTFEIGPGLAWDTRDHALEPHKGAFYDVRLMTSQPVFGSAYEYTTMTIDLRQYLPATRTHTLALHVYFAIQDGGAPFYQLPQLGGSNMLRGYYEGRYRDQTLMAAEAEYRLPLFWRISGVAFGGLGNVADSFRHFGATGPKWSLGGGLRFMLNRDEKLNLRADAGFGNDTFGFYVNAGEAF